MSKKELTERDRKIKEIRFLFKEEMNKCNLCSYWRHKASNSYDFCVKHWKKRDKEIKEWDNQNIENG